MTPKEFSIAMGKVIRAERLKRGLSMQKVAEHFGFTQQQQGKYELGINECSAYRVAEYAAYFGISIGELYASAEKSIAVRPAALTAADKDALAAARYFSRMRDDGVRGALLAFTRAISKSGEAA